MAQRELWDAHPLAALCSARRELIAQTLARSTTHRALSVPDLSIRDEGAMDLLRLRSSRSLCVAHALSKAADDDGERSAPPPLSPGAGHLGSAHEGAGRARLSPSVAAASAARAGGVC